MKNLNIFSLITEYDNAKSGGVLNVPNVSFVDEDSSVRYLLKNVLTHNGYEYVDLGLSVKWATCNVGATSPEQAGLYFAWGETTGYAKDAGHDFNGANYTASSISTNLSLEQDAAHVNLGGNWRMPTNANFEELKNNTTHTWTTDYNGTGVKGYIMTSKTNGTSVFFPAAGYIFFNSSVNNLGSGGYYWSSTWYSSTGAYSLGFISNNFNTGATHRCSGYSVRAVCE